MRRERLTALAGVSREWNWPGLGLATASMPSTMISLAWSMRAIRT